MTFPDVAQATDPRVLAEFSDYQGFVDALRKRATELKIALSSDEPAEFSGLPARYISKIIGVKPVKRIGAKSFGPILGTLGVKCLMVIDPAAQARIAMMAEKYGKSLPTRDDQLVRSDAVHVTITRRFMRKIGRAGGAALSASRTPRERSQAARRAAMARWHGIGRKPRRIVRI